MSSSIYLTIIDSYTSVNLICNAANCGGFVGLVAGTSGNRSVFKNCESSGSVTNSGTNTGSFAGSVYTSNTTVTSCGTSGTGAIIGSGSFASGTVSQISQAQYDADYLAVDTPKAIVTI
jgi:hypothetical protein